MFEAGLDGVIFYSHRYKLLGGFYRAAGDSPRPTAILLHGVPGVEKNMDIAYALRDAGWNCLHFHYRGCWGSEGSYAFDGLQDDVRAATEWVLRQPSVDASRLALAGNSLGGYETLAAGAADARFKALVSICPLVDPSDVPLETGLAVEYASMLNGVTSSELQSQWAALPPIPSMQPQLTGRPVLLVTGEQDTLFPPSHQQLLVKVLTGLKWMRLADGDHSFSRCRRQLVKIVVDWLTAELGQ